MIEDILPSDADPTGREDSDSRPERRRRWTPEAGAETAAALRVLAVQPWLIAGRDDAWIAAVRRNLAAIREALSRLGWVLVVERDTIRLRKSPPARPDSWMGDGPTPLQASWFFLLVAAAESAPPRLALGQLVSLARTAAAEADIRPTHDMAERRAIVRALAMLDLRGVVVRLDGDLEGYVDNEEAQVLLAVHHSRLAHVIANYAPCDPAKDSAFWLEQVRREPDPARRMRRKLIDDTLVHAADLDEAEADWLSRRVKGDDGAPLATAFGLSVERRSEGAAFVVPDDAFRFLHELGPSPFPAPGTVPHAALLLCEQAAGSDPVNPEGRPGLGWRGLPERVVTDRVRGMAEESIKGKGGWRRELVEEPVRLLEAVSALLRSLDLLRIHQASDGSRIWWFSPATGRWSLPNVGSPGEPRSP